MSDDLRRRDDSMIADFDKRLALLEQSQALHAQASDARWNAVQKSIETLTTEIRGLMTAAQAASADPAQSPAGRSVLADIAELKKTVAEHEDFVQQGLGALRVARWALATALAALGLFGVQVVVAITARPVP